jgi:hypothetical protein
MTATISEVCDLQLGLHPAPFFPEEPCLKDGDCLRKLHKNQVIGSVMRGLAYQLHLSLPRVKQKRENPR